MVEQMVLEGEDLPIAVNSFVRDGYKFQGWAKSCNSEVVFANGATIRKVDVAVDGTILYAI